MSGLSVSTSSTLNTCGPATISYSYSGSVTPGDAGLVLGITNANIDQGSLALPKTTIIETIAMQLPVTSSGSYTWDVVNVPAGYYILQAEVRGQDITQYVYVESPRLLVQNGTDVTCIYGAPEVEHKSHAGAIAGGVVGGIVGLLLLLLGAFFLNKKLKQRAAARRGHEQMSEEPRESFAALGNNNHRLSTIPPSTMVGSEADAQSQKGAKHTSDAASHQTMDDPFGDHNSVAGAAAGAAGASSAGSSSRSNSMRARNRKPAPAYDGDADAEARAAVENSSPKRTQHFLTPDAPLHQ